MTDAIATIVSGPASDSPDSPPADSLDTPINNSMLSDVKIDDDFPNDDSHIRHESVVVQPDSLQDASVIPELGTPVDPDVLPIAPPTGTPPPATGDLLEDVRMAEEPSAPLPASDGDVQMADADPQPSSMNGHAPANGDVHDSPATSPGSSQVPAVSSSCTAVNSLAASSPYPNNTSANDDDDKPPPAKRARKYSDAEKASLANTATPPPPSVSPSPNGTVHETVHETVHLGPPTFSPTQWRFCSSTIRTLKKLKDSSPFLHPVDPVALNVPHYPSIIKNPMDFSTIERKLTSSNPTKRDPNNSNPRYYHADEFVADVRLIFTNCVTFNGPEHFITAMGKRVEAVFDKQIKQMPLPEERKPPVVKKPSTPPPPPPPKKQPPARRPSTSVPVIRRSDANVGRPKREIHPPPPKDLPYSDAPRKMRKVKGVKKGANVEQLKFCDKVLKELHKKQYYDIAVPFYEPVDWVKLNLPSYPKLIKKPMDLWTIRKKLDAGEYPSADKFWDDFKLMIRNCFTFNPSGTPVAQAGVELQKLFDEKWKLLPRPHVASDDEDDDEGEELDSERMIAIATLESQMENMKSSIDDLKKKAKSEKKEKKKEKRKEPVASSSKPNKPRAVAAANKKKPTLKRPVTDDDVLSFEQKKDLSDTISGLDGTKLERVIQIIHEGVPEIRDSTEEIELEIDTLPSGVLTKLYNFVIRPTRPPPAKRARTGKGTGTGGLKRKSMDEDVEAEKIRVLEERIRLFSEGGASANSNGAAAAIAHDSEHSSDSSSDDSSGSESDGE